MKEAQLDAVLIPGGTSLTYFAGARWGNSERLMAVVIPASATPFVVIPAFEDERVREQLRGGPLESAELHTWQEDESPFARRCSLRLFARERSSCWTTGAASKAISRT